MITEDVDTDKALGKTARGQKQDALSGKYWGIELLASGDQELSYMPVA